VIRDQSELHDFFIRSATSFFLTETATSYNVDDWRTLMHNRITVQPQIHFGKPCVAGTRITVQSVLELVREGITTDEIRRDYFPDLTGDDVRACVQYAIDLIALEDIRLAETV
jgi:uncharacterized protein (DUF433 family)